MKRILYISVSIFLLLNTCAFATMQRPDYLINDGETYKTWGFTLSPQMIENKERFVKKPENADKVVYASNDWAGIVTSLLVKDSKLYVLKIDLTCWAGSEIPSNEDVFGIDIPERGLFADWYSGKIYTSWDKEGFFYFENGILKKIKKNPTEQ